MNGQYTLDADPMVLAKRVAELERACDLASGILVDLTDTVRVIADQCEKALDDKPTQAMAIRDQHERLTHIRARTHAMSVIMGRSY